jgi:hypothetical protein
MTLMLRCTAKLGLEAPHVLYQPFEALVCAKASQGEEWWG